MNGEYDVSDDDDNPYRYDDGENAAKRTNPLYHMVDEDVTDRIDAANVVYEYYDCDTGVMMTE